jgi:acetyl esterase/lipase
MYMATQTVVFKSVGACHIAADVYVPDTASPRPAILWIHGGALIVGTRDMLHPAQRDLYLDAGYVVVAVDYRLAPEVKLPAILEDLQDAVRWIRDVGPARFGIDPRRLAVVGHSAGGYLTLLSGYQVQPAPRALVSFYGYGDIAGAWYSRPDPFYNRLPPVDPCAARAAIGGPVRSHTTADEADARYPFYLYCRQQGLWPSEVVGRDPHAEPAAFDPFCPVGHAGKDYPPALLLHGDQDTDVPYEQSVLMARALQRAGVEHDLLTVEGGPHGFDTTMDDPAVAGHFARVLAFLHRHV